MSYIANTLVFICVTFNDTAEPWGLFFQDNATPQMEGLEELHNNIMYYLVIILFSVTWIIVINYIKNKNKISKSINHRTLEEILTITPALILILIAFPSFKVLYLMDEVIDPMLVIYMEGHQWYWGYQYPDFYNITYYSSIIIFSVTWIMVSIVINYKKDKNKISNEINYGIFVELSLRTSPFFIICLTLLVAVEEYYWAITLLSTIWAVISIIYYFSDITQERSLEPERYKDFNSVKQHMSLRKDGTSFKVLHSTCKRTFSSTRLLNADPITTGVAVATTAAVTINSATMSLVLSMLVSSTLLIWGIVNNLVEAGLLVNEMTEGLDIPIDIHIETLRYLSEGLATSMLAIENSIDDSLMFMTPQEIQRIIYAVAPISLLIDLPNDLTDLVSHIRGFNPIFNGMLDWINHLENIPGNFQGQASILEEDIWPNMRDAGNSAMAIMRACISALGLQAGAVQWFE